MTLTLELPPELEAALQEEAQQRGVEPIDIAVHVLYSHFAPVQHEGRLNRVPISAPTGAGKTQATLRLQAIQEFNQAAKEIEAVAPTYTGTWSREEIYEGDIDRILGVQRHQS